MDMRCAQKFRGVLAVVWLTCVSSCGDKIAPQPSIPAQSTSPASSHQNAPPAGAMPEATPTATHVVIPQQPDPAPEPIYRPADTRPQRDPARAAELGIQRYASRRLILYTDIPPELAAALPPVIDQAYDAWAAYLGELPPNREGTDYQITGYLMSDPDRFRAAGMLPEDLPPFLFGRHRGAEFWIRQQQGDYYRRHLLIHEATHCYMTAMPGLHPALWYLEGMAEYFGTHQMDDSGRVQFGIMPSAPAQVPGLGRIELIQDEVRFGRLPSLQDVGKLNEADFVQTVPAPYALSWGLCKFLDAHPRYQARFRELGRDLDGVVFQRRLAEVFQSDRHLLSAEWDQFIRRVDYGFDFERNAFVLREVVPLDSAGSVEVEVPAAQGWQSTGLHVQSGQTLHLKASGRVVLAHAPRDWESEPQGISIRYVAGSPIGILLAGILPDEAALGPADVPRLDVQAAGPDVKLVVGQPGVLFLRVNDAASELADNTGEYRVAIRAVPPDPR